MTDKEILKKLDSGKLSWNYDEFMHVKRLEDKGLTEYIADMHSGQWRLTKLGKRHIEGEV